MAKFNDAAGREWVITITAGDLKRIKREANVDLRDALKIVDDGEANKFAKVLDDPEQFLDLMWTLCGRAAAAVFRPFTEPIADDQPRSFWSRLWSWFRPKPAATKVVSVREQFEMMFDRETTVSAVMAVWEAVWDFFQGQKAGTQARNTLLAAKDQLEQNVASGLEKAAELVRGGLTLSDTANGSPASSDSTTEASRSAS